MNRKEAEAILKKHVGEYFIKLSPQTSANVIDAMLEISEISGKAIDGERVVYVLENDFSEVINSNTAVVVVSKYGLDLVRFWGGIWKYCYSDTKVDDPTIYTHWLRKAKPITH